jgi:glyoxylase-like metal-dependent hydrolase (beta-lactamase superfamily II)
MRANHDMSRRAVLQAAGAATAYAHLAAPAFAQVTDTPRGAAFHRTPLGAHELIVLSDGHLVVPTGILAGNAPPAELASFLASRNVGPARVNFHINVALLKTGDDYVLIDAGSGGTWEPTAGKLADSLGAAGIKPEQIGTVVLTHAHPDHLWGLIDDLDDSLRFPKARYLVTAREFEFWTMGEAAKFTGPMEGLTAGARRVFKAIEARTSRIKPGDQIAPGIVTFDTAGHTPGHISLLVGSGSDRLLVTADAIQNAHISMAHPDWQPRADLDGDKAAKSRRRLLDLAVADKLRVLSYHIPFPGLGRVERKGSAFAWTADA